MNESDYKYQLELLIFMQLIISKQLRCCSGYFAVLRSRKLIMVFSANHIFYTFLAVSAAVVLSSGHISPNSNRKRNAAPC